jgi:murein DD-endopeptidase MepM/ murein hydrolase activator NlpD
MKTIKTRSSVKNIKVLDKGVNLSKRMKDSFIKTKERAEETQNPHSDSPATYASEHIQDTARETVLRLPNPRQKARENWNRTKEHFTETKRHLPYERKGTTEQAQNTVVNTKETAENLRTHADHAVESAQDANAAVKDAKQHFEEAKRHLPHGRNRAAEQARNTAGKAKETAENLRTHTDHTVETVQDANVAVKTAKQHFKEVRQQGRQTLREVKQKVRTERGGKVIKTKEYTEKPPVSENSCPVANTENISPKSHSSRPGYLNKGVQAPKSAGGTFSTMQAQTTSPGKAVESTRKSVRQAAKGTIKMAQKSVKTAEKSAKATVKTAKNTAKTAQKSAQAAAKTARAAERAARVTAKTAVQLVKVAAKAVAALVKLSISAIKGLVAAIVAGGWVAVLVILIICMVGLLVGSAFGIFFSNEPSPDTGQTIGGVIASLEAEYTGRLDGIIADNPHDTLEKSEDRVEWREILAIYAVRATDSTNPLVVSVMDETNAALLREVFWDMHEIDYRVEEIDHPDTDADDDVDDSWTEYILYITITGKTAEEIAAEYGFTDEQILLLQELLSGEYDDLFAALVSGAEGVIGEDIVIVENGIYIWPSPVSKNVTSFFGSRPNPTTGMPDNHTGIDIAAGYRTPVLAAADGIVTMAGFDADGYGIYCIIDHGDGNSTLYAHMSTRHVREGDTVSQRQEIGLVGSTGWSTGNHIHFETRVMGRRVDPMGYFGG